MNTTIQDWIDRLENGEQVLIADLSVILNLFPVTPFLTFLPVKITGQENLEITKIDLTLAAGQQTIENLIIQIKFSGVLQVINERFIISEIDSQLQLTEPETTGGELYFSFNGLMGNQQGTLILPVSVNFDYSDYLIREWILQARLDNSGSTDPEITLASEILEIADIPQDIPGYFHPLDTASVTHFEVLLSDDLNEINFTTFNISFEDWIIINEISLLIERPILTYEFSMPYSPEKVDLFLEGTIKIGDTSLPRVLVDLPETEDDLIKIQSVGELYRIGNMSELIPLMDGFDIINSLPQTLKDFNGVDLTGLYLEINRERTGINYFQFAVSSPEEDNYEFPVLPGFLILKNISLKVEYAPLKMSLHGTAVLNQAELTIIATIDFDIDNQPESLVITMNSADTSERFITLSDLLFIGIDFPGYLPGLENYSFSIFDVTFTFDVGDTFSLTDASFNVVLENTWTILPKIEISNFGLSFEYEKSSDNVSDDYYQAVIHGSFNLGNEIGVIPIELTIPSAGDWRLELSEQGEEGGIALPGLTNLIGLTGINIPGFIPDALTLDGLSLNTLLISFPNPSQGTISSINFGITMDELWSFGSNFSLGDINFSLNIDYTTEPDSITGKISGTLTAGEIIIPVLMPLPFNSGEWTLQLDSPAYLPSLSYFSNLVGFDANNLLNELPGFSGIPEIIVNRFDIKFSTDPFNITKLAVSADLSGGMSVELPPGLEVRLDTVAMELEEDSAGFTLKSFKVDGAVIEKIGKETALPVTLLRTENTWELSVRTEEGEAITVNLGLFEAIAPGFELPGSIEDTGIDITKITLKLTHSMELLEFAVFLIMANANEIIGIDIFNDEVPLKVVYEERDSGPAFGVQILEWPFKKIGFNYLQRDGWILIDLWEFGALKFEFPTFFIEGGVYVINGTVEATHDGEEVVLQDGSIFPGKDMNIPLKVLFDKMGLSFLNSIFPDRIPLAPEINLEETIDSLGGKPENLPESFREYLDIEVPDAVEFDLAISSSGEVQVSFKLPSDIIDVSKPVRVIVPAGLYLVGIKVHRVGFTYLRGLPVLNLDVEVDTFLLPLLIALTWFSVDKVPFLPAFKDVHLKISTRDVWLLLSTYIPIPIFYDEISFSYLGIEGLRAKAGIHYPKPAPSIKEFSRIGDMLTQIWRFLSERDYYLTVEDMGNVDLIFSMEPAFLELPEYVGDPMIGRDEEIFRVSVIETIVDMLNTLKNPSPGRLLMLIPENIRYLDREITFGPITAALKTGITSVEEFRENTVEGYPSDILTRLFQDVEKGVVVLLYGHWQLANLVNFECMLGMCMDDFSGGALQAGIHGDIGDNFFSFEMTGVTVLDLDNRSNPFIFDLRSKIILFDHTVASLITRIDNNGFYMNGVCSLVDWSGFIVGGDLEVVIDTGGHFSLSGDAEITLAGINLTGSHVAVNNNSITLNSSWLGFDLDIYSRVSGNSLFFNGSVGLPDIQINQTIPAFTVHTPLGSFSVDSLHVECGVSSEFSTGISKDGVDLSVSVDFDFIKEFSFTINLPTLPVSYNNLKELIIEKVLDWIKNELFNLPEEAWRILVDLFKKGWAVVQNIAGILKDFYGKAVDFIVSVLSEVLDFTLDEICDALYKAGAAVSEIVSSLNSVLGAAGSEIASALQAAGAELVDIAGALNDILNYSAEQMVENFKKIGAEARDMARALRDVYNRTVEEITEFLSDLGQTIGEIVDILGNVLGFAADQIAGALQAIGAGIEIIAGTLVDVLNLAGDALASALNYIGATAGEIAALLSNVLGSTAEQIANVLQSLGNTAEEIAHVLNDVLGVAGDAAAQILNGLGYAVDEIGDVLSDVYHLAGSAAAEILNGIGATADAIASVLNNTYNYAAETITSVLSNLGYTGQQIAGALYDTLKLPAVRVADLLQGIGSAAQDVANYLRDFGVSNIGNVLEQVGYASDVIKNVLDVIPCIDSWICPDCCITDCCVINCCVTNCCIGNCCIGNCCAKPW